MGERAHERTITTTRVGDLVTRAQQTQRTAPGESLAERARRLREQRRPAATPLEEPRHGPDRAGPQI